MRYVWFALFVALFTGLTFGCLKVKAQSVASKKIGSIFIIESIDEHGTIKTKELKLVEVERLLILERRVVYAQTALERLMGEYSKAKTAGACFKGCQLKNESFKLKFGVERYSDGKTQWPDHAIEEVDKCYRDCGDKQSDVFGGGC